MKLKGTTIQINTNSMSSPNNRKKYMKRHSIIVLNKIKYSKNRKIDISKNQT